MQGSTMILDCSSSYILLLILFTKYGENQCIWRVINQLLSAYFAAQVSMYLTKNLAILPTFPQVLVMKCMQIQYLHQNSSTTDNFATLP